MTERRPDDGKNQARKTAGATLVDEVSERLRNDILTLELEPGTPLSEVELGSRFGTSRTPVRESLQRLSAEGLVKMIPGCGAFVAAVWIRDIVELFQMREALETYAARLAARSTTREMLIPFVERMEAMRDEIRAGRNADYYLLCAEADRTIAVVAGNERIGTALAELWVQVGRARRLSSTNPRRLEDSVGEHVAILSAIVAGDEEAAGAAIASHVKGSLHNILASSAGVESFVSSATDG